jgi:hypothetical protein
MARLRKVPALALFALSLAAFSVAVLAQDTPSSEVLSVWNAVAVAVGGLAMRAVDWVKAKWFSTPDPVVEQLEKRIEELQDVSSPVVEQLEKRIEDLQASRVNLLEEVGGLRDGEGALVAELRRVAKERRADWDRQEARYIERIGGLEDRIRVLERYAAGRPKSEEELYDTDTDAVGADEREEVKTHSGIQPVTWSSLDDTGGGT